MPFGVIWKWRDFVYRLENGSVLSLIVPISLLLLFKFTARSDEIIENSFVAKFRSFLAKKFKKMKVCALIIHKLSLITRKINLHSDFYLSFSPKIMVSYQPYIIFALQILNGTKFWLVFGIFSLKIILLFRKIWYHKRINSIWASRANRNAHCARSNQGQLTLKKFM